MKIKQIGAWLGGVALTVLTGSAGAGTLYNINATGVNGTTGSYNVSLFEDSIFSFHINSVASNVNPANTSDVTQVRLYFYSGVNGTGSKILSEATLMGGTNAGVWNNWGLSHNGNGYTEYLGQSSTSIKGAGGNQFQQQAGGYFNLFSANRAHSVEVELNNGSSTWIDTFNVTDFSTPEVSSLALLLPGLVPLGLVFRRRRVARR